jgi:hypothetical protein
LQDGVLSRVNVMCNRPGHFISRAAQVALV